MPTPVPIETIRAILDPSTQDNFQDEISGAAPDFYRGFPLEFQLRFDYDGELRTVANVSQVRLRIWRNDERGEAALVEAVVTSVDNTLTEGTWTDGTKQHALLSLSAAQTALPMRDAAANRTGLFWCVVDALLASGSWTVLGRGVLRCVSTGAEGDIASVLAAGALRSGILNLTAAQESGSVTGLAHPAALVLAFAHVAKPAGGDNIQAHVVLGTLDADGFDFTLSSPIPAGAASGDYKLFYFYR